VLKGKENKMKKNVNLPADAQYDYTDVFGARHYHTVKRIYLVDSRGYATSYSPTEYERIFNQH
jgi:hypothetical protein